MENSDKKSNDIFTDLIGKNLSKDHYEQLMDNHKVFLDNITKNFNIEPNDYVSNLDDNNLPKDYYDQIWNNYKTTANKLREKFDKEENDCMSNSNTNTYDDNLPKNYYRKIWSNHLIIMNRIFQKKIILNSELGFQFLKNFSILPKLVHKEIELNGENIVMGLANCGLDCYDDIFHNLFIFMIKNKMINSDPEIRNTLLKLLLKSTSNPKELCEIFLDKKWFSEDEDLEDYIL